MAKGMKDEKRMIEVLEALFQRGFNSPSRVPKELFSDRADAVKLAAIELMVMEWPIIPKMELDELLTPE